MAEAHLIRKGYTILHRNYRYLKAEIDILAQKGDQLVVVEVKTRSSDFFEPITDAVGKKKIRLLLMAADHYVTSRELDVEVRFDIVTILKKGACFEIEHLENAFYHF